LRRLPTAGLQQAARKPTAGLSGCGVALEWEPTAGLSGRLQRRFVAPSSEKMGKPAQTFA